MELEQNKLKIQICPNCGFLPSDDSNINHDCLQKLSLKVKLLTERHKRIVEEKQRQINQLQNDIQSFVQAAKKVTLCPQGHTLIQLGKQHEKYERISCDVCSKPVKQLNCCSNRCEQCDFDRCEICKNNLRID